jgi:hypothetical protein
MATRPDALDQGASMRTVKPSFPERHFLQPFDFPLRTALRSIIEVPLIIEHQYQHDMPTHAKGQSLTRLAARRLEQISSGQLSAEVKEKASLCLLDFLGACQSGLGGDLGEPLLKYAALNAGKPEAFAFGTDKLICAETAAFVHAVLVNR